MVLETKIIRPKIKSEHTKRKEKRTNRSLSKGDLYNSKRTDINPLIPDGKKRSHVLKQSCSFQLQVCLSMCDLFVTTRH